MARYLLIEFDNNEQADALRAQIDAATLKGRAFRVVGLFARPGKNCACTATKVDYTEWISKKAKAVMGSKLGLWICPVCKRPRFGNQQPTNLLKPADIIQPTTFQEVDWLDSMPRRRGWNNVPTSISLMLMPAKEG